MLYLLPLRKLMMFFGFGRNVLYFLSQLQCLLLFLCWGNFQEIKRLELYHLFFLFVMCNFSVTVVKKLLEALATFVGFFNFATFTSNEGTCFTECTFLVFFFIIFHVSILLLDFAISLL